MIASGSLDRIMVRTPAPEWQEVWVRIPLWEFIIAEVRWTVDVTA